MSNAERDSAGLTGMGGTPLAGRVALVTGASSGIGRATAKASQPLMPRSASPPAGPKVLRS